MCNTIKKGLDKGSDCGESLDDSCAKKNWKFCKYLRFSRSKNNCNNNAQKLIEKSDGVELSSLCDIPDRDLFTTLNFDPNSGVDRRRFSNTAAMQEIRRSPEAAARTYAFKKLRCFDSVSNCEPGHCYPLHQAIMLGATVAVIDSIYECYPSAIKAKLNSGTTALHLSFRYSSSTKVKCYLADKWPFAVREKSTSWCTALHCACWYNEPLKVILSLLEKWPEASTKQYIGKPTPLEIAKSQNAPDDVQHILSKVSQICSSDEINRDTARNIIQFFIQLQWWKGVVLTLDRHPAVTSSILDIDMNAVPSYLSLISERCKITTMWSVISNMQDVLADI